jgi:hypothetical protein
VISHYPENSNEETILNSPVHLRWLAIVCLCRNASRFCFTLQRQGLYKLESSCGGQHYDASSEAPGDKNLWSEKEYGDFTLVLDWRIKETPYVNPRVPIIRSDGTHKKDAKGKEIQISVPDSDSGVFLRGDGKSQINIWCWPTGSGEVYGYRMDKNMPAAVRAAVTPKVNADRDIGEWNTFEITMKGDRLNVKLNGQTVLENAQLPGIAQRGPLALQHHGGKNKNGEWTSPPALVQFRNISIREN